MHDDGLQCSVVDVENGVLVTRYIGFEDSEDVAVAVTVEVPLGEHKRVHMAHCHNGRCSLCCRQKSSLHMITRSIHLDRADGLICTVINYPN